MTNDEMIDYSIKELNNCEKLYIMFKDLSFLKGVYEYDDNFRKIKYMLSNAEPFEKHGDHAIKFSKIGFNIINNCKADWFIYKNSLKPKRDYVKIILAIVSVSSFLWSVYQGIGKSNLKEDNSLLINKIEQITWSLDSLKAENDTLKDSLFRLNYKPANKTSVP